MLLPCDHLSPQPAKPKPRERKKQNPSVRIHPIDDTCRTFDNDEFLPVLHPLPTNIEVGERHEDGQADEEEANITEPGEADYQSNDPVADMNEINHAETNVEVVYQSNDPVADMNETNDAETDGEANYQSNDPVADMNETNHPETNETNHAETDGEADYQSNDPVADMNETNHVETNGEDYQLNDPEAATSEAVVDNFANRPHRNRQAPQWFTYYASGHAACYHCRVIVTPPTLQPYQFQQFQPQTLQPYQFQQLQPPNLQPYQFQQFQPPNLQPLYQPISPQYLTPRPIQHPWYSYDPMFMNEW